MTASSTKPRCVLLDANIVIEAHNLGVWSNLKSHYQLILPATVCKREALFYLVSGQRVVIKLEDEIRSGEVLELEATAAELQELSRVFESWFLDTLDPGESEALSLLLTSKVAGVTFCTSDAPAIKALAMIGMSYLGIPFEALLSKIGLTKNLDVQFTIDFFKRNTKIGQQNLITRYGLAEP
jgi:hypothetical protein